MTTNQAASLKTGWEMKEEKEQVFQTGKKIKTEI